MQREVTLQKGMLNIVQSDLEDNMGEMVHLDSKLQVMLARQSIFKLWCILILELLALVFIILFIL